MKYARMKDGFRPIVLDGCTLVPPHPEYWAVPVSCAEAIELLVQDGHVEYRPEYQRPPADVALQTVPARAERGGGAFSRKRPQ